MDRRRTPGPVQDSASGVRPGPQSSQGNGGTSVGPLVTMRMVH